MKSVEMFHFNPLASQIPALHTDTKLSRVLSQTVDFYVHRRDLPELKRPSAPNVCELQSRAFKRTAVLTIPGWGNFTFGAKFLNLAQATVGSGVTHISVNPNGKIHQRGQVSVIGDTSMSLTPEWVRELPTVILRIWHAKQQTQFKAQNQLILKPQRHLLLGHSKGGCLTYLLACLRQSERDGRLEEFVKNLQSEDGTPLLKDIPFSLVRDVAQGLNSDVLGALGAPLYGVQKAFTDIAEVTVMSLGFNRLTANSGTFFTEDYMSRLFEKTGYRPSEVLDFVVTSGLSHFEETRDLIVPGASVFAQFVKSPVVSMSDVIFKGVSRLISPGFMHDGISPAAYPDNFREHIYIGQASHLDMVEDTTYLQQVFRELMERGIF